MFYVDSVLEGVRVVLQPNPSPCISSGAIEIPVETADVRVVRAQEERKDHVVNLIALTFGLVLGFVAENR